MKLLYLANIRLPTGKAHGVQIMKTCEALARAGVELELAVTDRATPILDDPFEYYGAQKLFMLTRLSVLDAVSWGRLGFYIESLTFARRARALVARRRPDIVYGRDEIVLSLLPKRMPLVWEAHTGAWNMAARAVARRARTVVVISQGLKDFYISRGIPEEKILIAPDAVDLAQFSPAISKEDARVRLNLPQGPLVIYTGSRQAYKGVSTLEKARALLGGVTVRTVSDEPYLCMPLYLRAADVLVLPNSAATQISRSFTSPMKLFEYMASGVPIVASGIPSIREVLGEEAAYLCEPDNPEALAAAIRHALGDPEASKRAARAKALVHAYTWDERAARILHRL